MRIDDFHEDDIRIIKMLYETIVNVEEKGLLPNRISIGLEQKLIRFISVVDNNIRFLALKDLNNEAYWTIMVIYGFAQRYFELVNAEKGISYSSESNIQLCLLATKFVINHEIELDNIAKRLFERLHSTSLLNNRIGKQENMLPGKLDTQKAKDLFDKISYCQKDGNLYIWNGSLALFGYFVDKTSDFLEIRPSNDRVPWKIYAKAFQMSQKSINTARNAVNDYKNKSYSEPEGYYEIKKYCNN